jgi:hypothetical protein
MTMAVDSLGELESDDQAPGLIRPMVRLAQSTDDLGVLPSIGRWPHWNRQQVLVAEYHGDVVGAVVLWDGGHQVLQAGPLEVVPRVVHQGVGVALCLGVVHYAREHGHRAVTFYVSSEELVKAVTRYGAQHVGLFQGVIYVLRDD